MSNTPLLQDFMSCFFDLVFLFSQHFPCFLFIIKKYCKLLEHLVWFVVSRIRLCILTEFCFKTLRQVITQHNPFTVYFQCIPYMFPVVCSIVLWNYIKTMRWKWCCDGIYSIAVLHFWQTEDFLPQWKTTIDVKTVHDV